MAIDRQAAARAIETFLRAMGHEPDSSADLRETGARVAEAWDVDLLSGYRVDVPTLLATESFPANGHDVGGVVLLRDVQISTMCPHHLLPAMGTATVAYRPRGRLVGLGTLARVVDAFARRLTLQERIGADVTSALMDHLEADGAAVALRLRHACLFARGERQTSWVETLSIRGELGDAPTHTAMLAALTRGPRE